MQGKNYRSLLGRSLCAAGLLFSTTALAGPAKDSIDQLNAWLLSIGSQTAEYAALKEEGDTAVVTDYKISLPFAYKMDNETFTISVSVDIPKMVLENAEKSGDAYTFSQIEIPELNSKTTITGVSLKKKKDGEKESTGEEITKTFMSATSAVNMVYQDVRQPIITVPAISSDKPVSGYIPVIKQFLGASTKEGSIESLKTKAFADGVLTQETTTTGIRFLDQDNGKLREYSIEKSSHELFAGVNDAKEPIKLGEITVGKQALKGIDINPVLKFFGASKSLDTKVLDSSEFEAIEGYISVTPRKNKADKLTFSVAKGNVSDVSYFPGDGSYLLALLDKLYLDKKINEEEEGLKVLQNLGDFKIGASEISGVQINGPQEAAGSFKLNRLAVNDLTSTSLGELVIDGMQAQDAKNERNFSVEQIKSGDTVWPSMANIVRVATNPNLSELEQFMELASQFGYLDISELKVKPKAEEEAISLEHFGYKTKDYIGPFPTKLGLDLKKLSVPVNLIDNRTVRKELKALGIEKLEVSNDVKIEWNENTKELTIDRVQFELKNGIKLYASMSFGNIERAIFEDPENAQGALIMATFNGATVEVADAPLIAKLLEQKAKETGMPEDMLISMAVAGLKEVLTPISDTPFAKDLVAGVETFLKDPKKLTVDLSPAAPVGVMQVGGMAALGPDQLPKMLGATVEVNQ